MSISGQSQSNNNSMVRGILVEDNKEVRDVFVELLEICNVDIIETGRNGKEGFELYQKFYPEIIFMDVMMPKYDGFYGLEKIMEYDSTAKVILVTASDTDQSKFNSCGATAIIENPIKINEVKNIIERFCANRNTL